MSKKIIFLDINKLVEDKITNISKLTNIPNKYILYEHEYDDAVSIEVPVENSIVLLPDYEDYFFEVDGTPTYQYNKCENYIGDPINKIICVYLKRNNFIKN